MTFSKEIYEDTLERLWEKLYRPVAKLYVEKAIKVAPDPKLKELLESHKEDFILQFNPLRARPLDEILDPEEWKLLYDAAKHFVKFIRRKYRKDYIKVWITRAFLLIPVAALQRLEEAPEDYQVTNIQKEAYKQFIAKTGAKIDKERYIEAITRIIPQKLYAKYRHVYLVSTIVPPIDELSWYYKFKNWDIVTKGDPDRMNILVILSLSRFYKTVRTPVYGRKANVPLSLDDLRDPKKLLNFKTPGIDLSIFLTIESAASPAVWVLDKAARISIPVFTEVKDFLVKALDLPVDKETGIAEYSTRPFRLKDLYKRIEKVGVYELAEKIREIVDTNLPKAVAEGSRELFVGGEPIKDPDELLALWIERYKNVALYPGFTNPKHWNLRWGGLYVFSDLKHAFIIHNIPMVYREREDRIFIDNLKYIYPELSPWQGGFYLVGTDRYGDEFELGEAQKALELFDQLDPKEYLYKEEYYITPYTEFEIGYSDIHPIINYYSLLVSYISFVGNLEYLKVYKLLYPVESLAGRAEIAMLESKLYYNVIYPELERKLRDLMTLYASTITEEENLERFKWIIKQMIKRKIHNIRTNIERERKLKQIEKERIESRQRIQELLEQKKKKERKAVKIKD
jgi:hypothetical protein